MSIAMLPKLKDGKDVTPWLGSEWKRISSLNEITKELADVGMDVSSDLFAIPDVYEKAIRFTNIIRNPDSYRNASEVKDIVIWRGILTLLALQAVKNYPISFSKRDFSNYSNGFAKALEMEPTERIFSSKNDTLDWSWLPFYTVEYNKQVIALFSPSTLIYPIVDIDKKLKNTAGLDWYDEERRIFRRPELYLSEDEKILVYIWLENLYGMLSKIRNTDSNLDLQVDKTLLSCVMNHIRAFQNDLGVEDEDRNKRDTVSVDWILKDGKCFQSMRDISAASVLNVTMKPEVFLGEKSISLNEVFSEKILCMRFRENPFVNCISSQNYKVEEMDKRDGNWTSENDGEMYALLPLSESFMNVLSGCSSDIKEKIAQNVRLRHGKEYSDGNERDFILAELNMGNIDFRNFKISKKYYIGMGQDYEGTILEEQENMLLCVWPGFYMPKWNGYYVYCKHEPLFSGASLYHPVLPDSVYAEKGMHCLKMNRFPEEIGFLKDGVCYGMIQNKKPLETRAEYTNKATAAVDFGTTGTRVFVKINDGRAEEILLTDENVLGVWDKVKNIQSKKMLLADEFIPMRDQDDSSNKKLFSVYHYFGEEKMISRMLLDGNIYMPEDGSLLSDQLENNFFANTKVITNLKWNMEATGKYFTAFMMQVCMQITAYLYRNYQVADIEWRYSVPSSMSVNHINNMKNVWQNLCLNLKNETGLEHHLMADNMVVYEGYASSFYFNNIGVGNYPQGFYSVDIGGGTTDIALWQKTAKDGEAEDSFTVCRQLSVKAAGRRILTTAIWDYIEEFCDITRDFPELNDELYVMSQRKRRIGHDPDDLEYAAIDKIISIHEEALKQVIRRMGSTLPWLLKFRARLAMNISMLMYCLGRMMAGCIKNGSFKNSGSTAPFQICIGGNGGSILDWIELADWDDLDASIKQPYINMFRAGRAYELERIARQRALDEGRNFSMDPIDDWKEIERLEHLQAIEVQIYKSPAPKQEVAKGLLNISQDILHKMQNITTADHETFNRNILKEYTQNFLGIFCEEFAGTEFCAAIINKNSASGAEKINYPNDYYIMGKVDQLFRGDNDPEHDAYMCTNVYEGLFNHVLLDYLNEEIRP